MNSAPTFLDRDHDVVEISGASDVEQYFINIGKLLDDNRGIDSADLNRAKWLLATLRQLPVPITWYEETAYNSGRQTLKSLIARIGALSRFEQLGAVLQSIRMQFELLYLQLGKTNPRAVTLKRLLPNIASNADKVLVLVRDRTTARALRTWIDLECSDTTQWQSKPEVLPCTDYANLACTRFQRALICGVLPRRHRWIGGAALANHVCFLAYPHETDIVEQQLGAFYNAAVLNRAAEQRNQTVAALRGETPPAFAPDREKAAPCLRLQRPPKKKERLTPISSRSGDLSELARLVAEAERRESEAEAQAASVEVSWRADDGDAEDVEDLAISIGDSDEAETDAFRFYVRSSTRGVGYIWLRHQRPVECVSPKQPTELRLLPPDELEAGDVVLRLEEGGRADLFVEIVELAENHPHLAYLGRFRRAWREAMERLAIRYRAQGSVDYSSVLASLQENGARIQSYLTVRNWIENEVIGPEDVRSVIAVGRVAGLDALVRNAKDFDRAFRRIRGIHQGVGRRLNSAIRAQFHNFATAQHGEAVDSGSTLDSNLVIPLEELLENMEYLEVLQRNEMTSKVPLAMLDQFSRA